MSFSVGIVTLPEILSWSQQGRQASVEAEIYDPDQSDPAAWARVQRDNLGWMTGTVQPVAWGEDSSVDGFYRVLSVDVRSVPASVAKGFWSVSLELEALPNKRTAVVEATFGGAEGSNAPGAITAMPWYAVPSTALAGMVSATSASRIVAAGVADEPYPRVSYDATGATLYSGSMQWIAEPASFLDNRVKVLFDGYEVEGLQDHDDVTEWEMNNGIVKVEFANNTISTFTVTFPDIAGGSGTTNYDWGTAWSVKLGWYVSGSNLTQIGGTGTVQIHRVQVLRSEPGWKVCRLICSSTSTLASNNLVTIDVSLRRGSAIAEVVVTQAAGQTAVKWGLENASCTNAISNAGIRSGSVENVRLCLFVDPDDTVDTTNGLVYCTTATTQARLGIACALNDGATTPDDEPNIRDQFYARQTVVERIAGARL